MFIRRRTWNRFEECFADVMRVFHEVGGLTDVSAQQARVNEEREGNLHPSQAQAALTIRNLKY